MMSLYTFVLLALLIEKGTAACYVPSAGSGQVYCSDLLCLGSCTTENGCFCSLDETKTCLPAGSTCLAADNTCCPTGYFWSPTDECCTDTVNCFPSCQNDEICQKVNNVATCTCNTTNYSGMSTSSLVPSVKCESSIMTVSVSKCLLEKLGFDSNNLKLNEDSDACTNVYAEVINDSTMKSIQVLPKTGWCGNVVTTDSSKVYYTNTLQVGIKNSSIITVNPLNVSFTCSYNLSMQTSLAAAFHPVVSSVNLTINGEGSILTRMAAYWDQAYANPIKDGEDVPVGSFFFLGLFSDAVDGNQFALRVESCFATPDGVETNVNKVQLVSGGCPANQEVYTDVQSNGNGLEARIKVSSFAFKGQSLVYITCAVRLCNKNGTCTGCNLARSADNRESKLLTLPMNFYDDYTNSAPNTALSWAVLLGSVMAFLSNKFI
ncbi:pancreatic secretory granule membrane major glycoprotein GP2-like [Spea bombifrons]|uniref:pancreatic secretory granule membrane major glycoprotein GP2-like n=1 Tax=Spea bombifrons TaxID=233779 RepID=UPI00234A9984|nr:pancreatic secretory granule membrane major glycoprotein GP2-like [Spea bombifrons]